MQQGPGQGTQATTVQRGGGGESSGPTQRGLGAVPARGNVDLENERKKMFFELLRTRQRSTAVRLRYIKNYHKFNFSLFPLIIREL